MKPIPRELEEKYIADAIAVAKEDFRCNLKINKHCLHKLDKVALHLHDELDTFYATPDPEFFLCSMAIKNGAVIVAYLRMNHIEGDWFQNHEQIGRNTYPFVLHSGMTVFPMAWVMKRVLYGPEESSLVEKYDKLVADLRR